jgi:hypothetical protein
MELLHPASYSRPYLFYRQSGSLKAGLSGITAFLFSGPLASVYYITKTQISIQISSIFNHKFVCYYLSTNLWSAMKHLMIICILLNTFTGCSLMDKNKKRYDLSGDLVVQFQRTGKEKWGLEIERNGEPFFTGDEPVSLELFTNERGTEVLNTGYDHLAAGKGVITGKASVSYGDAVFCVTDTWNIETGIMKLDRKVEVQGDMDGGFMSGIGLIYTTPATRDSVRIFAPGMIYGTTDYLTGTAIGGSECTDFIRIREDRLPAPLFGAYFSNGTSLTVLNSKPDSRTTKEDSRDLEASTLIDEQYRFGSIGADFDKENPAFGYWFPGSEGGITYKGRTYPYGQMKKWSRRYHPIRDGLQQEYQVSFRFAADSAFHEYYTRAWRWAWSTLQPGINYQDIEMVKRSVLSMLGENVESHNGITGIRNFIPAPKGMDEPRSNKTIMGFTGKTLETANFLLAGSLSEENPLSRKHRELGEAIVRTFLNLNLSPPAGEGFTFEGKPEVALGRIPEPVVYLRSFGDGLKELLKAVKRERQAGIEHGDWIAWAGTFADWLLFQQSETGGFPRTWKQGTGEVVDPFPESSYTVIPFLVLMSELTGDGRYVQAALKAGEFCWNTSQSRGIFIGGTIDNPNVIDKEAGTISLEAHLALYRYTRDKKWLDRAIMAGNFAETWIYLWNVPMPEDEDDSALHWKKGLPTVGMQLISTGHSLTDEYMAFDVDEFAELFLNTSDNHYYDVAMILLHNTKTMLALPGREFDLKGPGWMQEHWSLAPVRGFGMHRGWLPWVSTSLLNGIFELQELDEELYRQMINPK